MAPALNSGTNDLVVLAERVADAEEAGGSRRSTASVIVEAARRRRRSRSSRDALPGAAGRAGCRRARRGRTYVGPGDQGDEVRRERLRRARAPTRRARPARPGALPITVQSVRGGDVQRVRRLEVGLVEAGEDAGRGVHEAHAVDVVPAVGRVDAAVQPLAVVAEPHRRRRRRARCRPATVVDRQPAAVQQLSGSTSRPFSRIRCTRSGLRSTKVSPPFEAEADRGDRAERLVVAGEVEADVVLLDVEEGAAGLGLGVLEAPEGVGAHRPHPRCWGRGRVRRSRRRPRDGRRRRPAARRRR